MFVCSICGRAQAPRVKSHRVVVETRPRVYPFRLKANRLPRIDSRGRRRVLERDDPGGRGREIVREAVACPGCAAQVAP